MFARQLTGESGNDLPENIGTITKDLRTLADDVDLLGPKAPSVGLRAGYISWALAVSVASSGAGQTTSISRPLWRVLSSEV